jgi:hypothetical protein
LAIAQSGARVSKRKTLANRSPGPGQVVDLGAKKFYKRTKNTYKNFTESLYFKYYFSMEVFSIKATN